VLPSANFDPSAEEKPGPGEAGDAVLAGNDTHVARAELVLAADVTGQLPAVAKDSEGQWFLRWPGG